MNWSDEREAEFKGYYAEGISHGTIAARMGITRNASIGKAHRLGLEQRAARPALKPWVALGISERTWQRHRKKSFPYRGVVVRRRLIPEADRGEKMTDIAPAVGCGPLTLMDLERHSCRWPVEVPGQPMMYCGDPKASGSYCARHCRMAYAKPTTRPVVYFSTGGRVV
jgi:GcrA cell cycle regulator